MQNNRCSHENTMGEQRGWVLIHICMYDASPYKNYCCTWAVPSLHKCSITGFSARLDRDDITETNTVGIVIRPQIRVFCLSHTKSGALYDIHQPIYLVERNSSSAILLKKQPLCFVSVRWIWKEMIDQFSDDTQSRVNEYKLNKIYCFEYANICLKTNDYAYVWLIKVICSVYSPATC